MPNNNPTGRNQYSKRDQNQQGSDVGKSQDAPLRDEDVGSQDEDSLNR